MPAATPPSASPPTPGERTPVTRCILWRPAAIPTPAELLASLQRRAILITECTDAYAALAHLCRLEHSPPDRIIFLLVNPAQLPDAPSALDAAARYAPHAACWWYDARTCDKLCRVTPGDIAAWTALHTTPAPRLSAHSPRDQAPTVDDPDHRVPPLPRRSTPPSLRLISDDADPAEPAASASSQSAATLPSLTNHAHDPVGDGHAPHGSPSATLLTNEELAMLLAEPPSTPAPPPQAAGQRTPWWRRPESGGVNGTGSHEP